MTKYTLYIKSRNYSQWDWVQEGTQEPITENEKVTFPFPIPNQLFHGDQYCSETKQLFRVSSLRTEKVIPGILILEGNRTYGRQVLNKPSVLKPSTLLNRNKGRLYYRCIPYHPFYPCFLVPYALPMDFSKHTTNLFVLFQYKEWKDKIAPYGGLIETIGAVNHLPSYYRYLLVSRKMEFHPNHWIPNALNHLLITPPPSPSSEKSKTEDKNGEEFIFSIDPLESRDLDDAFSFQWRLSESGETEAVVRIYIADVVYWIEEWNQWDALRLDKIGCSTIYLPDQNHPLLPRWISDKKGSLLEGEQRPVVGLELVYRNSEQGAVGSMVSHRFFREYVQISRNYRYDTRILEECPHYQSFLQFTRKWVQGGGGGREEIADSHDLVEYWMIEYNIHAANALAKWGKGIFRRVQNLSMGTGAEIPTVTVVGNATRAFLKHYKKVRGEYVLFTTQDEQDHSALQHTSIREGNRVYYAHASSPLRRLVDIYNQLGLILSLSKRIEETGGYRDFQTHMENSVVEINRQTKLARRIQSECETLADFFSYDASTLSSEPFEGTVVDLELCTTVQPPFLKGYWVFLEQWKRLVYVTRQHTTDETLRQIGETGKYQIFLFEEEEKAHKKIMVRPYH